MAGFWLRETAAFGGGKPLPKSGRIAKIPPFLYFTSLSWSRIAGFSSVDTSCVISSPFASERSSRRMILPERVFGRLSPKRMSFGLAIGPISLPTQSRSSFAIFSASAPVGPRLLQHDERAHGLAGHVVGTADHRRLGDQRIRHQRRLDFHRAEPVPGDVQHVVDAAHDREVAGLACRAPTPSPAR